MRLAAQIPFHSSGFILIGKGPDAKLLFSDLPQPRQPVRLGSRAISILSTLIQRPGELVTKDDLLASTWPATHVEEGNLRVHIAALMLAAVESV